MHPKRRSHHELAELAGRQHGVVSSEQLLRLRYGRDTVKQLLAVGRLHPLFRSVYALGHPAVSREGSCLAATLSCGEGALVSHRSAAWLWGLTQRFAVPVEVTAASARRTRGAIRVHSAAALTDGDRTESQGIPVTAVPRTLLDFAAADPGYLVHALDRAHRLGLLDVMAIDELVERSRGFRGVARLRTALELHRPRAFTRSGLERRFLKLVKDAGLPKPSMNLYVEGYEVDAFWPEERFAVELDTYEYHGSPAAFETDRLRQESLKLAGIEMVRITGIRMDREPGNVAENLRRLLRQRHRELHHLPDPP